MSVTLVLILIVAVLCFIAAWMAVYAFATIGQGKIANSFCFGLGLISLSWLLFSTVAISSYDDIFVDIGLSIKIIGVLLLIRGFALLKRQADDALHPPGTVHRTRNSKPRKTKVPTE